MRTEWWQCCKSQGQNKISTTWYYRLQWGWDVLEFNVTSSILSNFILCNIGECNCASAILLLICMYQICTILICGENKIQGPKSVQITANLLIIFQKISFYIKCKLRDWERMQSRISQFQKIRESVIYTATTHQK